MARRKQGRKERGRVILTMLSEVDLEKLLDLIVLNLPKLVGTQGCSIFLENRTRGDFELRRTSGLVEKRNERVAYKEGEGLTGWICRYGKPLRIKNVMDEMELTGIDSDLRWTKKYSEIKAKSGLAFLGVPLISSKSEILGVIRLSNKLDGPSFTQEDEDLLVSIASKVALAIENATLYQSAVRKAGYLELLSRVGTRLRTVLDRNELLRIVVESAAKTFSAEACEIYLRHNSDPHRLIMRAAYGVPENLINSAEHAIGEGITGWIVERGKTVRTDNVLELPQYKGKYRDQILPRLKHGQRLTFLGVPLKCRGKTLGVIKLYNKIPPDAGPDCFTEEDERYFEILADETAVAVENANLFQSEKRRGEYLELLATMGIELGGQVPNIENLLRTAVKRAAETFSAETCELYLRDETDIRRLIMRAGCGVPEHLINRAEHKVGEGITGWIVERGAKVRTDNVLELPQYKGKYRDQIAPHLKYGKRLSFLGVPLKSRGKVIGVMKLYNKIPGDDGVHHFTEEDERYSEILSDQIAVVIENARYVQNLHDVAVQAIQMQRLTSLGTIAVRIPNKVEGSLTTARMAVDNLLRSITSRFSDDNEVGEWLKNRLKNIREPLDEVDKSVGVLRTYSTKVGLVKNLSSWSNLLDQSLLFVKGTVIAKRVNIKREPDKEVTLPSISVEPSEAIGVLVTILQILLQRMRNYEGAIRIDPRLSHDKNYLTVTFDGLDGDKEFPLDKNTLPGEVHMDEDLDPLRLALDVARNTIETEYKGALEYKPRGDDKTTFTLDIKVRRT